MPVAGEVMSASGRLLLFAKGSFWPVAAFGKRQLAAQAEGGDR